ncbi:MAG: PRC-barrel domain-containing protein [Solirubrobacteraceae bacterium]
MIEVEHIEGWRGQAVVDSAGEQLGKLDDIYFDRNTGTPMLIALKSGLLSRRSSLVPIDGASVGRDYVRVAYTQEVVDQSPGYAGDGAPAGEELYAIGAAYGLKFSDRVELESSGEVEQRLADARAARERAEQLSTQAQEKLQERETALQRAQGASAEATKAEREAEEARQAALDAQEHAAQYDED